MVSSSVYAHDFWLEPDQFQSSEPRSINLKFKVGHKDDVSHWGLRWDRIVGLRVYSENQVADMAASIIPKNGIIPGSARTEVLSNGTHIIGFESYHSFSELEANRFNNYAKKEGLSLILSDRKYRNASETSGKEIYSRKAKSIVQIGDEFTPNVTQPIGQTLEIVPVDHPYSLDKSNSLRVKVLFKGEALPAATIDLTPLHSSTAKFQSYLTDSEGLATFESPADGSYRLNVVWGVPISRHPKADFETYFSSLTVGKIE